MQQHFQQSSQVNFSRGTDGAYTASSGKLQFKTAFQPIFRTVQGQLKIAGHEALLRVAFEGVTVSPGVLFNRLRPEDRLTVEATSRALHITNSRSIKDDRNLIFINFDPSLMSAEGSIDRLMDDIVYRVRLAGKAPRQFVCEITEQAVTNPSVVDHFAHGMRARGFLLAVDDYGAAASNRLRINRLYPDIVKFDAVTVRSAFRTPKRYARLIDEVKRLHSRGISVVLEGLETINHVDLAIRSGSDMFQGFGLAKPRIAPASFPEWATKSDAVELHKQLAAI